MKELSLFTGIGGGVYGSQILGWQTIAYVEKNDFCQQVIKQRIADGIFEQGEIYGDIADFNKYHAHKYAGEIDVLTGGFPCQPFSLAGKQKGTSDNRYLFDEIIKTIKIIQPKRIFFENVRGLLNSNAIVQIFQKLANLGYDCKPPLLLGSSDCGNVHQRKRLWIYGELTNITDTTSERCKLWLEPTHIKTSTKTRAKQSSNDVAGQTDFRSTQRKYQIKQYRDYFTRADVPEPLLCRVDNESTERCERIKAIGNGQDPVVMATAYYILTNML
ncbi:DNA cytosine methyltransferase [Actinobacillus delphinicola]|uniref:Cytosine-specific methyltransferase n=1 Tax=Actinobacillus delphinicola TaxID=51161 RepID=A0A448TUZ5_9PAST|nr:DNA (cytosine-5-)-methyltransferase [Actinobacillus delphinicola]VEJ09758.1 Modification methylase HpaII [Actinobacillus delphinicola]